MPEPDDLFDVGRDVRAVDQSFKRSKFDDRLGEGLAREATAVEMLRWWVCMHSDEEVDGEHRFCAISAQLFHPDNWKEPLTFVYFDGLILKHRNGNRYSLYLSWHDDQWHWYSGWLGNTRSATSPSAVLPA